jgi:hypothetical protein
MGRCLNIPSGNGVRRCGLDASDSGWGPVAGSCEEHVDEPSGSIKGGELLD